MNPPPIAAWLESYRAPLKPALGAAARDGFAACSVSTLRDELRPDQFGTSARRHFARYTRDVGLALDALTASFADTGLANPARADARLAHLLGTIRMARDLGLTRCVVTTGGLDADAPDPLVREALARAAELADGSGVDLAIHPAGGSTADALRIVRALGSDRLGVALDTADLALPRSGLTGHVGGVLIRDVRTVGQRIEEVPFGTGQVDFEELIGALSRADYAGAMTIRQDAGNLPESNLRAGRERIERLLAIRGRVNE